MCVVDSFHCVLERLRYAPFSIYLIGQIHQVIQTDSSFLQWFASVICCNFKKFLGRRILLWCPWQEYTVCYDIRYQVVVEYSQHKVFTGLTFTNLIFQATLFCFYVYVLSIQSSVWWIETASWESHVLTNFSQQKSERYQRTRLPPTHNHALTTQTR